MVKKLLLCVLILAGFLIGCNKDSLQSTEPLQTEGDVAFGTYEEHFLENLWKLAPDWAITQGYHKYDSVLLVPSDKNREKLLNFSKVQVDSLSRFDVNDMPEVTKMDYHLIQTQMEDLQFRIQALKDYQWDPSTYNVIDNFANILTGTYAPLDKRLKSFYERMANIPAYYKEAEKQIKNPVVELTNLAIDQHLNGVSVIEKDFIDSLKKSNIPEATKKLMTDRAQLSAQTIKAFAAWLKALNNTHPRSFRLGKQLYEEKFKNEIQSQYTAQQIYNSAIDRKKNIHREMAKISRKLWPKYFGTAEMPADSLVLIRKVLDTLSADHTTAGAFKSNIEGILPKLTQFVQAKDLLTIYPSKLVVRTEPGYLAGVAGAGLDAPGPYDKNGIAYYEVGSFEGWSPERIESYLREYNKYELQILCIHEAIPGHYVQLTYANKSTSLIKSVFANSAMIEGWAVYGEQMMLDNGYDNDDPEMRLMWYKWHLRSVCNTLVDYSVHTQNMTKEQVLDLLIHEAFQQKAEAEGKWTRLTLTSVQLDCYYTGYKEIMDLRETWKKKMGDKYKLKDFNEKFLSYGNAPVMYIKQAMTSKEKPVKQ